eukprot:6403699-Amphidinium_carterae.1
MKCLQKRDSHRLLRGSAGNPSPDAFQYRNDAPHRWLAAIESQVDSVADRMLTPPAAVQQFWLDALGCWSWLADHPLVEAGQWFPPIDAASRDSWQVLLWLGSLKKAWSPVCPAQWSAYPWKRYQGFRPDCVARSHARSVSSPSTAPDFLYTLSTCCGW